IVPFFFFYSFWGEKWQDSRPLATVGAMISFSLLSSIRFIDRFDQLAFSLFAWTLIFVFPFLLYDREYIHKTVVCHDCKSDQAQSKGHYGTISLYRDEYRCSNHSTARLIPSETRFTLKTSLLRRALLLGQGVFFAPWGNNLSVALSPSNGIYNIQDPYDLAVQIRNRMKDRAIASVQVAWHSTAVGRPISVFAVDPGPCEGHKTSVTTISAKIPTISWERAEPT